MTPADLRALAKRVERSQAPNDEIAIALGWRMTGDYRGMPPGSNRKEVVPIYYDDLNAIAAAWQPLREMGWKIWMDETGSSSEPYWLAQAVKPPELISTLGEASTLPRAWLALLLRCLAAEMEDAHD